VLTHTQRTDCSAGATKAISKYEMMHVLFFRPDLKLRSCSDGSFNALVTLARAFARQLNKYHFRGRTPRILQVAGRAVEHRDLGRAVDWGTRGRGRLGRPLALVPDSLDARRL